MWNTPFWTFVLSISMLKRSRILKILVLTPHNTPIIMWGYRQEFLRSEIVWAYKFQNGVFFPFMTPLFRILTWEIPILEIRICICPACSSTVNWILLKLVKYICSCPHMEYKFLMYFIKGECKKIMKVLKFIFW